MCLREKRAEKTPVCMERHAVKSRETSSSVYIPEVNRLPAVVQS